MAASPIGYTGRNKSQVGTKYVYLSRTWSRDLDYSLSFSTPLLTGSPELQSIVSLKLRLPNLDQFLNKIFQELSKSFRSTTFINNNSYNSIDNGPRSQSALITRTDTGLSSVICGSNPKPPLTTANQLTTAIIWQRFPRTSHKHVALFTSGIWQPENMAAALAMRLYRRVINRHVTHLDGLLQPTRR